MSFCTFTNGRPTTAIIDLITPAVVADKWELPHSCLKLGSVLGEGAFGQVRIGYITSTMLAHREVLVPFQQDNTSLHVTVAIKLLQDDSECRYKNEFLREINLMKELGLHQNIVSIVGCCTLRDPICLVVEHVPNGDLLAHLKCIRHRLTAECSLGSDYENTQRESLDGFDILSFSRQIAMGMEFLSEKGYVHRDLAARNILIGENNLLKIGDFGLARYIYDDKIYINRKGGKLPLKWMSVEAIFELAFSTASDVWSFGVVLFEIVTFGGTPYPTIPNKDLLQELSHGYRMEKPDNCSQQLYDIMMVCWNENPRDRPSFTDLRQQFEEMMEGSSGVPYLQLNFNLHSEYYRSEVQESVSRETIDGASTPANMDDTSSVVSSCSTSNKRGMSVKERICGKKDVTQLHMQHIDVRTVSNSSERLKMRRHCDSTVDDVFSEVVEFELIPLRDSQSKQLGELLRCDDLSSSASSSSSSCDLLLHPARLVSASSTDSAFPASPLCLRASGIADNEIDTDDALSSRNWFWGTSEETSNTLLRSKSLTLPRLTLSHEVIRSVMTFDIENDLPKLRSKRISSDHSNSSKDSALPRSPNLDMDIGPHYDLAEGFADSGV